MKMTLDIARSRSGRRAPALAFACALLAAPPAAAAQGGLDNLASLATMTGTCASLVVRGADVTNACEGRVLNSAHTDGRSGFAFIQGRSAIVSFAGQDSAAIGDRATLHVDMVLVARTDSGAAPKPEILRATGECTYTNPYIGVSTIICRAATSEGAFSATFRSDGRPPEGQRFSH